MSETITLSDHARWVIDDDGNPTFHLHRGNGEVHLHEGPIPWGEVEMGETVIHLLGQGNENPTEADVLAAGEEVLGWPLGGKTWQKPAPFRIRDIIEGARTAAVESTYVDKVRFGYVVRHRYGRWLALDLNLDHICLPAAPAGDTRADGLYPGRQEAVHRVIANYQPADRYDAHVQADALYEEASRLYESIELLQTLLREEERWAEADTLDLPLARAYKHQERRNDDMLAVSKRYPAT